MYARVDRLLDTVIDFAKRFSNRESFDGKDRTVCRVGGSHDTPRTVQRELGVFGHVQSKILYV